MSNERLNVKLSGIVACDDDDNDDVGISVCELDMDDDDEFKDFEEKAL